MAIMHQNLKHGPIAITKNNLVIGTRYHTEAYGHSVALFMEYGKYHVIGYNMIKGARTFWATLDTLKQAVKVFKGYERLIYSRRLRHLETRKPVCSNEEEV